MRQLLAILALGLAFVAPGSGSDGSIEDVIDHELPASGVPGLAYAVVADGEITSEGARGVVSIGGDTEVTPSTQFVIGSISKSFTALAVMQLVEAGEVDLDGEIARYLDVLSGKPAGPVTIRQLLSHTSGYSTLQGNSGAAAGDTGATGALERAVDARADVTPAYAPGARWEYSNLNYQTLGRLIEVVSGQSFQAYLTATVLEPVGMANTVVADGQVHGSMATGHAPWFTTSRALAETPPDVATAPQGGIISTAGDLARYLAMMMNGEDDVLSAAGKAQMMRPASAVSPGYGFGWYLDRASGGVWHTGLTPGFESLAWMLPAQQRGAVVLVNGVGGIGFGETTQLRTAVAASGLGVDYAGEGSRLPQKALVVGLVLLPIVYLLAMIWAWRHRAAIRAKSGVAGRFSLWFPLLTTSAAAAILLVLVPRLFGSPLPHLSLFVPDFVLALVATAVMGVLWAVFRLMVAYTGRSMVERQT
ncbi:serine hydrolase [uncultured Cellulomonas sp.]|uniref:serine hydrolase domain-containing protein n=1 Tax=uncultured Cellulomonas sp. TaxID=189682 RepID=UPI00262BBD85|nr:serine hydrolase domain-containing protein [uncultured Cellulomonas sp.]